MPHLGSDQPDLSQGASLPPTGTPRPDSQEVPQRRSTPLGKFFRNPYTQIILSVVLNAAAQILLKIGADQTHNNPLFGVVALGSLWVWAGIVVLIVSLGSWMFALRFVPLNIAYNLAGLLHALVPLGCWFFLGEKISLTRCVGILCVILGVYILARPVIHMEERM